MNTAQTSPKVAFFLQRRFAMLGHAFAVNLKTRHGITDFCGYVSTRPAYTFLTGQNDITYSSLILDEDIHTTLYGETIDYEYIDRLEKEYGVPNLWPYLVIDRVYTSQQLLREYPYDTPLLSHEDMLRALQVTARAVISFLEREKPDVLVISVIGSVASLLLHHVAKKKGITVINIDGVRIKNRVALSTDYRTFTWARARAYTSQDETPLDLAPAIDFLTEFRDRPAPHYYKAAPEYNKQTARIAHLRFLRPSHIWKSVQWHVQELVRDLRKESHDYTDIRMHFIMWDKLKRKVRGLIGYSDLYSEVMDEPFTFFPLHFEPEIATMLYAPQYTDQVEVIRHVARALPVGQKLYVKEHAAMVGFRTRAFYKEILKNPNVKLISPSVPGQLLIQNAKLVVTITGTAGWEAILLKKPVVTFGEVFYNDLSFVKRCTSYETLADTIAAQLETWTHNEEELVRYIAALIEDSVPVEYADVWENAQSSEEMALDEGIIRLSDLLAQKIQTSLRA